MNIKTCLKTLSKVIFSVYDNGGRFLYIDLDEIDLVIN